MSVNFDHTRKGRIGIPEVILAEPKTKIDLEKAITAGLERNTALLITRIMPHHIEILESFENNFSVIFDPYKRTAIIGSGNEDYNQDQFEKSVAILSGGTSDQPIVEEILMSLRYFGIGALYYSDIGVAGIHRHQEVLQILKDRPEIKILIVVAGNEGALFSVISGQSPLPIIAVPTSIGYGFGGKGITALQSALQSCAPGIVTVNIDNGFGAAAFVKKMITKRDDL